MKKSSKTSSNQSEDQEEETASIPPDFTALSRIDVLNYVDSRGFNYLMLAAQRGDTRAVKQLLRLGLDPNTSVGLHTAISLAYNNNHFDTVLALLRSNSKFPDSFDADAIDHEGLRGFVAMTRDFYASLAEVFPEGAPVKRLELRHFFSLDRKFFNRSAAFVALRQGKHTLYHALTASGVTLAPDELRFFPNQMNFGAAKRQMTALESRRYSRPFINLLQVFCINCFIGDNLDEFAKDTRHQKVVRAFKYLIDIEELRPVLEFVSQIGRFRLVLDFDRDLEDGELERADTKLVATRHMFVGVRGLLHDNTRVKRAIYGVIAREVTGYALEVRYRNAGLPYKEGDRESRAEYERIVKECETKRAQERLIDSAFEGGAVHTELIRRVPQLIAEHFCTPAALEQVRAKFRSLFEFYAGSVLVDVRVTRKESEKLVAEHLALMSATKGHGGEEGGSNVRAYARRRSLLHVVACCGGQRE